MKLPRHLTREQLLKFVDVLFDMAFSTEEDGGRSVFDPENIVDGSDLVACLYEQFEIAGIVPTKVEPRSPGVYTVRLMYKNTESIWSGIAMNQEDAMDIAMKENRRAVNPDDVYPSWQNVSVIGTPEDDAQHFLDTHI